MSLLTRRFPTIVGLLLLLGAIGAGIYFFQGMRTAAPEIIPQSVRITNVTDNKFSVSWITEGATPGSLEYGPTGEKLEATARDERDTGGTKGNYVTHHVTVSGLQPSTQYAFRILTGEKPTRFDNKGAPYTTMTGPVIGATPPSQNFYGTVELPSKQSPDGAIVYVSLPGAAPTSTLVRESGNYAVTLSTIRAADLRSYVTYDASATIVTVTVESGKQQSTATVSLANSAPVPTITLGQNADFRNAPQTPAVAEIQPAPPSTTSAETPTVFNVEPLTEGDINAVTTGTVTLLNPKEAGETLATLRPEFRGTGPKGTTLSIALKGQKAVSDTTVVATDGTWSWTPTTDLKVGQQTITVSYVGSGGTTQKIERVFVVATSSTTLDPAFVSSPSASTKASAIPSPTPRVAMPATDSGVPVTGVIENTLLTAGVSLVIMIVGALLLAL